MSDLFADTWTDVWDTTWGEAVAITLGIDVSAYQGGIDWTAVAKTPYRFALARMTVGMGVHDDLGRTNLSHMLGKIPVPGAYGVVGLADPVEAGADFLIDEIASVTDPKRVLVMLDAENYSDGRHPTIDQVDRYAIRIHQRIGRWPVAYVPAWWMRQHGYTAAGRALANCPWAPSHYLSAPWTEAKLLANKPPLEFGFKSLAWLQYTSSASVSGISGNVDANCFYGTLDQLRQQLIGGMMSATGPEQWDTADWTKFDVHVYDKAVDMIRQVTVHDQTKGAGGWFDTLAVNAKTAAEGVAAILQAVQATVDPATVAALVAGQLEITGISTDPTTGVISVNFGPKATT